MPYMASKSSFCRASRYFVMAAFSSGACSTVQAAVGNGVSVALANGLNGSFVPSALELHAARKVIIKSRLTQRMTFIRFLLPFKLFHRAGSRLKPDTDI